MAGYKNNSFSQTEAAVEVTDELVTARDKVKTKTAAVVPQCTCEISLARNTIIHTAGFNSCGIEFPFKTRFKTS